MSITKFTRPFYNVYSKCPPFALMQARRHLQKLGIDFLITSCCSSSHIIRSPIFSCSSVADSVYYLHNIMTYNMTVIIKLVLGYFGVLI